jgi:hypothetical protein
MRKITVADLKRAVAHVNRDNTHMKNLQELSDEEFLNCDFIRDLNLNHVRLSDMVSDLRHHYGLNLPLEIFKAIANNSVRSFLDAVNLCLEEEKLLSQHTT